MQISRISFLLIPLLFGIPLVYADHTDHDFVKTITIESDDVDSDLTDFPLLLNFTDSDLQASAFADGLRITFTNSTDDELSHEIEQYTSGTGWLTAWVKVPNISSSSDTEIFMYYSNNTNLDDQQSITDTWREEYKAVYHLNDDLLDSTINDNDGTNDGTTDVTDEHIADSQDWDGINDEIRIPQDASHNNIWVGGGTFSIWVNPDSDGESNGGRVYQALEAGGTSEGYFLFGAEVAGNLGCQQLIELDGVDITNSCVDKEIQINTWNYVVITNDGTESDGDSIIYVDGISVPVTSPLTSTGSFEDQDGDLIMGNNGLGSRTYDGSQDEVRWYDGVLTPAWIDFEHCNTSATTICEPLTIGGETSFAPPPWSIDSLTSTSITSTTVVLDWTEPELNGESLIAYQINYTTPQSSTVKSTGTIFTNSGTIDDTITGLTGSTEYSTTVSAITAGGKNVTFADVYNFTTSAPITGKFIWFNCSLASNSTQGCIYAMFCPVGEFVNGFWENGTASCAVP